MRQDYLKGIFLLETLISIFIIHIMIVTFTHLSTVLFKLERHSINVNVAICLMDRKVSHCKRVVLNNQYFSTSHKKYGKFQQIQFSEFKWICNYKRNVYGNHVNTLLCNIRKRFNRSYENSVLITLYLIMKKILYAKLIGLDVIILWKNNYIRTATNVIL